jgi:DNA-binding NarL/FixJ family response regulator
MHAQRVRGMLSAAGGNRVAANQAFERALQAGARLGMPLEVARVHLAFARALIDAGDPAGARRQLGAAERLFASAGASGWAPALERLGVQLARLGGQHPKEHLTKRETRVAELAAQGLSNPEIAAALFLSRKTVEYHLSNVFTKLDITNRRVLADLFGTCDGIEPGAG